jgi:predicted membrane metal-binding protein
MNELLKSIHWKKYWLSFLFLSVCIVIWCSALWLYLADKSKLAQSEMAVMQQKSINDSAEQSVVQLRNFYGQYQQLKQQGLVGEPPRLEWAEVLLEKYQDYRLPGFYFVLSPTEMSKPEDNFFTSDVVEIKKTPMQISFNLLHEGDFYRYLRSLHQQAKGQFSVQECMINRDLNQTVDTTDFVASFKGQCDIIWFSFKDITATWPEGVVL